MIPFWEYILGTGPIFFLGIGGAVISIIRRDRKFQPLIFWTLTTFFFAILFTQVKEQSPLRFTQTGLFIPLGILGTYFFQSFSHFFGQTKKWEYKKIIIVLILALYIAGSLFMMKVSLDWQTTWITQKIRATIPSVPYPPQAMYPLKSWMDGIRYLRDNTGRNDIVMAEVTAGNYIPAYSGNTVYFGQANTVGYEEKQLQVDRFFKGEIPLSQASIFLKEGRIKYVFYALQEKEMAPGKNLTNLYPQQLLPKPVFSNEIVTIYEVNN